MKKVVICVVLGVLAGCSRPAMNRTTPSPDTTASVPPPPPPPTTAAPAAWKENSSLIGAALVEIRLVDPYRYVLTLDLRTVLPAGSGESLAEPGQRVEVVPDYVTGPDGGISLEHERNQRLYEVRKRKAGEPVMGKITLGADGVWHLVDTGLK